MENLEYNTPLELLHLLNEWFSFQPKDINIKSRDDYNYLLRNGFSQSEFEDRTKCKLFVNGEYLELKQRGILTKSTGFSTSYVEAIIPKEFYDWSELDSKEKLYKFIVKKEGKLDVVYARDLTHAKEQLICEEDEIVEYHKDFYYIKDELGAHLANNYTLTEDKFSKIVDTLPDETKKLMYLFSAAIKQIADGNEIEALFRINGVMDKIYGRKRN